MIFELQPELIFLLKKDEKMKCLGINFMLVDCNKKGFSITKSSDVVAFFENANAKVQDDLPLNSKNILEFMNNLMN